MGNNVCSGQKNTNKSITNYFDIKIYGLSNSGKTTILYQLKESKQNTVLPNKHPITNPTPGFHCELINYKNIQFTTWDVGAEPSLWSKFDVYSHAIIYIIDCSGMEIVDQSLDILYKHLEENDKLNDIPILLVCNKQDLPNSIPSRDIIPKIEFKNSTRKWTCIDRSSNHNSSNKNLMNGLEWLKQTLTTPTIVLQQQ